MTKTAFHKSQTLRFIKLLQLLLLNDKRMYIFLELRILLQEQSKGTDEGLM